MTNHQQPLTGPPPTRVKLAEAGPVSESVSNTPEYKRWGGRNALALSFDLLAPASGRAVVRHY